MVLPVSYWKLSEREIVQLRDRRFAGIAKRLIPVKRGAIRSITAGNSGPPRIRVYPMNRGDRGSGRIEFTDLTTPRNARDSRIIAGDLRVRGRFTAALTATDFVWVKVRHVNFPAGFVAAWLAAI
jgi:hypothetical protein